jgi:hypothetical protein
MKTHWRALMQAFVLFLLFTQQSWSGIDCHWMHQDESPHACYHAAQHGDPTAEAYTESSGARSSLPCMSEEMPTPDTQFDNLPQSARVCCHSLLQTDVQGLAVSSTNSVSVEHTLPLILISAQPISAPASTNIYPQHRKHPLYLALSCWLI